MMTISSIFKELKEAFSPKNWSVNSRHTGPVRIAICDDYSLYRRALSLMLAQIPNFEVVIEAANGKALLDKIVGTRPDVVLLDMDMPVMNGETTANYLLQHYSNIRIILLTLDRRHPALPNLLKTGVSGFVYKGADLDEFECAIWEFVPLKQYWQKYR